MASELRAEDVTGWIPETTRDFDNKIDGFEITDGLQPRLDERRLRYFQIYAEKNFNGPLEPGLGVEDVFSLVAACGRVSHWLDLGAGTSSLFWAAAVEDCQSVTAVDASAEALMVLKGIVEERRMPQCYRDALSLQGRHPDHLLRIAERPWRYLVLNFVDDWPKWEAEKRYDLITGFGCFGIDSGAPHFRRSVEVAGRRLALGGHIVGANWLRTRRSIETEGYDTSFLTPDFIEVVFAENDLLVDSAKIIPIKANERHEAMLVWRGKRA